MVYFNNEFLGYSYTNIGKSNNNQNISNKENFADLTFNSVQKLQENSYKLFDTSNLEKKKLSGSYTIEKSSLPLAGLKYMVSKLPEMGYLKQMEEVLNKNSGDNFFSAISLNLLKMIKDQNLLIQNLIDYIGDNFEITSIGSTFEVKLVINIVEFIKTVSGIDLESSSSKLINEEIKNYSNKWIERNPKLNIKISGIAVDKEYDDRREDLFMFNNINFDLDFPLISSPLAFSSFVEKDDNSKAYLSGILNSDIDSLTRKSGHAGLVFELKKTTSSLINSNYFIIGTCLVIILLTTMLYLR